MSKPKYFAKKTSNENVVYEFETRLSLENFLLAVYPKTYIPVVESANEEGEL